MTGGRHNELQEAADAIGALLASVTVDPFQSASRRTVTLSIDGGWAIHVGRSRDRLRSADPIRFSTTTARCFCEHRGGRPVLRIGRASEVRLFEKYGKALLASQACVPEPSADVYADMVQLAALVPVPSLTVVNLAGSGASVPQHFHAQVLPLQYRNGGGLRPNSYATMLAGLQERCRPVLSRSGLVVRQVDAPLWGVTIQFDTHYSPRRCGTILHGAIHRGLRYRSQLQLAYNLYLRWHDEPRRFVVLFREPRMECPFGREEILAHVEDVGEGYGGLIRMSDNARWRWGWLEAIGGLPTRDDFLADSRFGPAFWGHVYASLRLPSTYRTAICRQLSDELP